MNDAAAPYPRGSGLSRSPMRAFIATFFCFTFAAWSTLAAVPAERPVSDPVYGPLSTYATDPAVASDGEDFLVVWHDSRLTPGGTYAARVSRAGVLLDPTGIRVPGYTYQAVPLFAGGVYVILTQEQGGLYSFTIGRDGTPAGRRLLTSSVAGDRFVAASNGSQIVVAWPGRLMVFGAAGDLLSSRNVAGASTTLPPAIASNGLGFLLAWRDSNYPPALNATALDAMGQSTGASSRIAVQVGSNVSLASNGRDYVVIYDEVQTRSVLDRSISGDGLTVGAPATVPSLSVGGPLPPVVWNGSNYLFFSRRPQNTGAGWPQVLTRSRLDGSGSPLEPDTVAASGFEIGPIGAASNGHDVLAAWSGRHVFDDLPNISVALLGGTPDPATTGTVISRSANAQSPPSIAFSGSNYLVVRQERSGIYFNRVLPDGEHLDGAGTLIESLPLSVTAKPRVIFDGTDYVIAWSTYADQSWCIRIARVRPDSGAVIEGPVTMLGSTNAGAFDLAAGGGGVAIVWTSWSPSETRLNAARLDRKFQVIDIRDDLAPKGMSVGNPAIVWNGSEWFVAFDQQFFCEVCLGPFSVLTHANVLAVRLSSAFTLLDPQPIAVAVSDSEYNLDASIATNGDEFLVAWTGGTPLKWDVRVRHVKAGALVDAIQTVASGAPTSAAWDRDHYAVAYTATAATGTTYAALTTAGTAGAPPRGERQLISATGDSADHAQLAATRSGVTAAYIREATEAYYGGVARIFVREPGAVRPRAVRSP